MTDRAINRRPERDKYVMGLLDYKNWRAIADITGNGLRIGSARLSLQPLMDAKQVTRQWDGNERYGRFVYQRA